MKSHQEFLMWCAQKININDLNILSALLYLTLYCYVKHSLQVFVKPSGHTISALWTTDIIQLLDFNYSPWRGQRSGRAWCSRDGAPARSCAPAAGAAESALDRECRAAAGMPMAVDGADRGCPTPCRRSSGICNDRVRRGYSICGPYRTEILRAKS